MRGTRSTPRPGRDLRILAGDSAADHTPDEHSATEQRTHSADRTAAHPPR